MKKIIKLTDKDLSKIIEGVLKEQVNLPNLNQTAQAKLQKAVQLGCISKYGWFKYGGVGKTKSTGEFVIYGTDTDNTATYYFYPNMTVKNMKTQVTKTWTCPDLDKTPGYLSPEITRVLEKIKKPEMGGWFTEPVPSVVDIEDGEFTKDDMAKPKDPILKKYQTYFNDYIAKGFPIYRRGGAKPTPGQTPTTPATQTTTPAAQSATPTNLDQGMKDILDQVKVDFNEVACKGLIDTYFELAQAGKTQDEKTMNYIKENVYGCFRKNMRNFENDTKDKLRWLSGNEEDAKNVLGMKKFKQIGNIRQDDSRRAYRLDKLPAF